MDPPIVGRREQLLLALRRSGAPRTIGSLAEEAGVHVNTVRFHLDGLVDSGRVERVSAAPSGPGRPAMLFRAARRMNPSGPTNYRLLSAMLTGHLAKSAPDPIGAATRIGRAWGPTLLDGASSGSVRTNGAAAVQRMIGVLDDLGFEPEPPSGPPDTAIRLRHCPFLDLVPSAAGAGDSVVCALHLGLMQGMADAMGNPVDVVDLHRFAEPDVCVAHLSEPDPEPVGLPHGSS